MTSQQFNAGVGRNQNVLLAPVQIALPSQPSQPSPQYSFYLSSGTPYGNLEDLYTADYEDYDDNNKVSEEEAIMAAPGFVSPRLDLVVNEGETIRLPCVVSRWVMLVVVGAVIRTVKFSVDCS